MCATLMALSPLVLGACYRKVIRADGIGNEALEPDRAGPTTTITQDIGRALSGQNNKD
ncbi:MAG: hypothetical protein AAF995_08730 [Planctomycetota bacterium]